MKWETLDDFLHYHFDLINKITERCADDWQPVAHMAFDLWEKARKFANRSYITLCFDCVYVIANATGNKVSITLLQSISADLLEGRRVKVGGWPSRNENRWFVTDRGKHAIMSILDDEVLYADVVSNWSEEE